MKRAELITAHGLSMTLKQWAVHLGVEYKTLWMRIKDGHSLEAALVTKMAPMVKPRDPEKTMTKTCKHCQVQFVIPMCRDWRENCCSSECKVASRETQKAELRLSRTRECKKCGAAFVVKKSQIDEGGGNYCSVACHYDVFGMARLNNPEAQMKAVLRMRELRAAGKVKYARGAANWKWKGGVVDLEKLRAYQAKRRERTKGVLPKDLVAKLLAAQKGCCTVCRRRLKGKFHKDHIYPLAKGGKHHALNIQLLCPTCNHQKAAKDPVEFMQQRGYLL